MLAITLYQPWGNYVADGTKPIENRPWAPSPSRCPPGTYIAIHAGNTFDRDGAIALSRILEKLGMPPMGPETDFVHGAVVGVARFDGVIRSAPPPEVAEPSWFFGPVGWVLRDACPIAPVRCAGSRGLWPLPPGVEGEVRTSWQRALRNQFRVPLRGPADLAAARAAAQRSYPAGSPAPESYTCDRCPQAPGCAMAFDGYNTHGDCLLEK